MNEKNKTITIAFLNAILQRTGRDKIKDVSFENVEAGGEYERDKQSRLDILAVSDSGEWINIEIQFSNQYDMIKRSLYYWAGVYRTQAEKRTIYKKLNPAISINILNFDLLKQTDRFHTTYHVYEDEEKFKLTDALELHFVEMTKFIRDWQADKLDPKNDVLARWLLMLGMIDRRNGKVYEDMFNELEEIAMKDDTIHEAFENWEVLSGTQKQMIAYEGRMKRIFDEESAAYEAKLRMEEVRQEAELRVEKAKQEAELRVEKARQEERQKTARLLLLEGFDVATVVRLSGLEENQVIKIQQKLL